MSFTLFLAFVLLLWIPQNVQHEGMHALAAKSFGAYNIKMRPYPKWEEGKWWPKYWALMSYRTDGSLSDKQYGLISCAPQLTNTVIMIVVASILFFVTMPTWLTILLFAVYVVNFTDGCFNLSSLYKMEGGNDAWTAIKYFNIKLTAGRAIVTVWNLTFILLGLGWLAF